MQNHKITLMGITVDSLSMEATIAKITKCIDDYALDENPRYISTLNVDFLVNAHNWHWRWPRNPELLRTLRQSAIVTADGMPILWISRLMGCPIQERIAGTDLFPALLQTLAEQHKAIYLIGGTAKMVKIVSVLLEALYPGLTIAGISTPYIDIEGEKLVTSVESDSEIVTQINAAAPDILFISLGNPKQETWYHRIKDKLRVPVSIGIGGTLEITFGSIGRAPKWMQNSGLEWAYRLGKEPYRLWRRYLLGGFKFTVHLLPLLLCHGVARAYSHLAATASGKRMQPYPPRLFLSSSFSIAILELPPTLPYEALEQLLIYGEEAANQDATVLDFTALTYLPIDQLSCLAELWNTMCAAKQLFAHGISPPMRLFLKIHRLWDLFEPYEMKTTEQILTRLSIKDSNAAFFHSIQQTASNATISLLGALQNDVDYPSILARLNPSFHGQECFLDLRYCSSIGNAGIAFLLKLRDTLQINEKPLKVIGIPANIYRQLKLAKVEKCFQWA